MTRLSPSPEVNPEKELGSPEKDINLNSAFDITLFRPLDFDTKLNDFYYFTDVYIPR